MGNALKQPLFGIGATFLASIISLRYFQGHEVMAICAFVSIGLGHLMDQLLTFNREVIWGGKLPPRVANRKLAFEIAGIFAGIFLAAMILNLSAQVYQKPDFEELYSNTTRELFIYNSKVLVIGSLLAFIYRANGLVLVLCWNALGWAEAISTYLGLTASGAGFGWSSLLAIGLLPHLLCEALSYILGGMGALFLSKAFTKYTLKSPEFAQVFSACVKLFVLSMATLFLSVVIEVYFAQPLFHTITGQ